MTDQTPARGAAAARRLLLPAVLGVVTVLTMSATPEQEPTPPYTIVMGVGWTARYAATFSTTGPIAVEPTR